VRRWVAAVSLGIYEILSGRAIEEWGGGGAMNGSTVGSKPVSTPGFYRNSILKYPIQTKCIKDGLCSTIYDLYT
jgi:hypothetical protein